ncbi:unnamed protein product [Lactuca virosa]|uniref:Uncharacterized protein n=1 Tax=Lactuca virosa TaxID=75947 RepID=A0AAU9PEB6_9ASTR|nr:unnamed protein product [Lactuca virosa]
MSRNQFTSCLILASPPFPPASLKLGSCLKSYTMMMMKCKSTIPMLVVHLRPKTLMTSRSDNCHHLMIRASGSHFQPQHEYHSYQQHNEPDPEHEFPLDIYSQLASLRLQGNRNTAAIRRIEEQQARANNYMEDLWYHFRPEDGYPPRGPPPP